MALNLNTDLTTTRSIQDNWRAIERHLDYDHYTRGFTPGDFILDVGGNATPILLTVATNRWPAVMMPEGRESIAITSFHKPSEWRSGKLKITYWYTSDVGSTNNFYIGVTAYATRRDEVLNGTSLYAVDTAVAGPAVASTVKVAGPFYTTTSFGSDDELFAIGIFGQRANVLDTNVNEFHLLYVLVEHIPAQQVSE